jgi:small-conductance mechanosensitive channel
MGAKSDVMIEIYNRFKEQNIKIPLPQREVKVVR